MSDFEITLPSRGLYYEGKLPGGKIQMSPMTGKEQAILYNPGAEPMKQIEQILRNCVKDSPVPVENLLITDRTYAMVILRIRSFPNGGKYEIPMRCGQCNTQFKHTVDLVNDLKVKVYEEEPEELEENCIYIPPDEAKEPFTLILPMSEKEITYRLLRGYDESQIAANSKRFLMQSSDIADPSFCHRVALMVQTIDGEKLDWQGKFTFANSLLAGDVQELNDDADYNESGMSLLLETVCNRCGYTEEVGMHFTAEFFRPKPGRTRKRR